MNALPARGTVKIRLPGTNRFVELEEGQQIPVGTVVDTLKGRVTLVAAGGQQSTFYDGIFKIGQGKGAKPLTTLTLVEKLSCPKAGNAIAAAKKKKRRLWGDGSGKFRTKGKHSAATVVGTQVAGRGPVHVDSDARRPRPGMSARLRQEEDRDRARRQEVRGQSQETVSWTAVLAGFFVAHMVGDYLLQTDWQARHKTCGLGRDPVARRALSRTSPPTRSRSFPP